MRFFKIFSVEMFIRCITLGLFCTIGIIAYSSEPEMTDQTLYATKESSAYIKWVDYTVSTEAMAQALKYDIDTYEKEVHLDWIELLSYAAAKNGGKFSKRSTYIDRAAKLLTEGESIEEITADLKYYPYYYEAYSAVLGGFVGEFWEQSGENKDKLVKKYGLKVFSPIAANFWYSHYDDFGNSRSYGFKRRHLGNDLLASIGTPIVAVESGIVEEFGWNQYGGWRVGIRSFDGKRYWYYAHMRKNHPYHYSLSQGDTVYAGQVIGYVGMTGYSSKENVNGMTKAHLHFGLQLIFDESQKEGNNEIWIDVYQIVNLLQRNTSVVAKDSETKDYNAIKRIYPIDYQEKSVTP